LQISEKESRSVEISVSPFPLHLLEHRKRSYSALFCVLRENKNSRFCLEISSLLLFAFFKVVPPAIVHERSHGSIIDNLVEVTDTGGVFMPSVAPTEDEKEMERLRKKKKRRKRRSL